MLGAISQISQEVEREKNTAFRREGGQELGPTNSRGCTDIIWIPIFVLFQAAFVFVTLHGLKDGNPEKLYRPRDFQGAYCGVEDNWNNGPNTLNAPVSSYTMNTSSVVDQIFQQTICSSFARQILTEGTDLNEPLLWNETDREAYLCDCCFVPCSKCAAKTDNGGDITSGGAMTSIIGGRLGELTGLSPAANLFNPSVSKNGNMFGSNFWEQANKHFNLVCLPSCSGLEYNDNETREYKYSPTMDDPLYAPWNLLMGNTSALPTGMKSMLQGSFTFTALPFEVCPYPAKYCVPMPGVDFKEMGPGYCTFELAGEVIGAVGDAAASAFATLGGDAMSGSLKESAGQLLGDFQSTLDSFIIVSVFSFVVGIIFLVLLRFFLPACIHLAILATVLMFVFGGAVAFVRSEQCAGAGLFDTGKQAAVAVAVAGAAAVRDHIAGGDRPSEYMDPNGDGSDYRGHQTVTVNGRYCVPWDNQTIFPEYNSDDFFNESGIEHNYCRNPYEEDDINKGRTIWCVTNDPNVWWEECSPIGVIMPVCRNGYEVPNERNRKIFKILSYIVWGSGVAWVFLLCCMRKKIEIAIALNQVAAAFLGNNPHIVLVPMVQAVCAIAWTLFWGLSASFLLSQVPADYVPTGYFATYAEAYGTDTEPGQCTGTWPTGYVWKDEDCEWDGETAKCWRCSPPRFNLDWRFWTSLFVYTWDNAFNVALGQIFIAMAVCVWFFLPSNEKGTKSIVKGACRTIVRYHLGSVMFGSFIVALIQFIRYVLQYLEKQSEAQKNKCMVMVLRALQCCMWCFEKCIQFLNKNAYIQIALMGTSFCTSAKRAFFLILRNALSFGAVAALSYGVHAIGFVTIMGGTLLAGYFTLREMHADVFPLAAMLAITAVSWIVAKLYMNVFGLAVDTALQCFLVCQEMGEVGDFIPAELTHFIDANVQHQSSSSPPALSSPPAQVEENGVPDGLEEERAEEVEV